jgi:hypothetical protein
MVTDKAKDINMSTDSGLAQILSYNVEQDPKMLSISLRLKKHLQNLQANATAVGVVPEAIQQGRAAVEEVLARSSTKLHIGAAGV